MAFHENAVLMWEQRSCARPFITHANRHSEIGSHTPPKTAVFIGGGAPNWSMANSYENASFGSHDKPRLVCRGFLTTYEKPTMNSEYEFIVATPI